MSKAHVVAGVGDAGVAHRVPLLRRERRAIEPGGLRADVHDGVAVAEEELARARGSSTAFSNWAVTFTQSSSTVPLKSAGSTGRVTMMRVV